MDRQEIREETPDREAAVAPKERFTTYSLLVEPILMGAKEGTRLFPTIWMLFRCPGKAIRAFLSREDQRMYFPFKLLVLVGTVMTVLSIRYRFFSEGSATVVEGGFIWPEKLSPILMDLTLFLSRFFSYAENFATIINIISIPIFSLFTYLFFEKEEPHYYYGENLILNTYITSNQLVLLLAFVPFLEWLPTHKALLLQAYTWISVAYNAWVLADFFEIRNRKGFFLLFCSLVFSYVVQFLANVGLFYFVEPYVEIIDKLNLI